MAFSPVRTMSMKKIDQELFIVEDEGVSSFVLPAYVHRSRTKISIPCVPNVLTDGVKKIVHRESFESRSVQQHIVCEQSKFFTTAESREHITGGGLHDVVVNSEHMGSDTFQVHDH